jgi:hypothetical protein
MIAGKPGRRFDGPASPYNARGKLRHARTRDETVDFIEWVIKAGLTIIALVAIVGAIAALFMFIFSIATGIDERIQS